MDEAHDFLYFSDRPQSWTVERFSPCALEKLRLSLLHRRLEKVFSRKSLYFSSMARRARHAPNSFLHIEDIRSRSERYAWEIDAHTHHGLFQALFIFAGGAELRLDATVQVLSAPCAVTIPPSTVHAFRFEPGTQGYVLTLAAAMLVRAAPETRAAFEAVFGAPAVVDSAEAPEASARLAALLDLVEAEFRERAAGSTAMQEWLVSVTLLLLARRLASAAETVNRGDIDLVNRYRTLIEDHYATHKPAGFYAETLRVTESRLARACRAVAGKSPFEVAQDRLLLEARRKLIYIAAPVSLIAYELGFEDPAYFWRFFKRRTGMTPNEFRKRRQAGAAEAW